MILFILLCVSLGGNIFAKLTSKEVDRNRRLGYPSFLFATGVTASSFLVILAKFRLHLNALTAAYSVAFGVTVVLVNVFRVKLYQLAGIAHANMMRNAASIVAGAVIGWLLFSEKITFLVLLRMSIILVVVFLILADMKKSDFSHEC